MAFAFFRSSPQVTAGRVFVLIRERRAALAADKHMSLRNQPLKDESKALTARPFAAEPLGESPAFPLRPLFLSVF